MLFYLRDFVVSCQSHVRFFLNTEKESSSMLGEGDENLQRAGFGKDRGDTVHGGALSLVHVNEWSLTLGKPCYVNIKVQRGYSLR